VSDDELELTLDEMVDRMRQPLAELEAVEHELDPAMREFARGMRAAIARYDELAGDGFVRNLSSGSAGERANPHG
jgi:exonuclease VII small subunit